MNSQVNALDAIARGVGIRLAVRTDGYSNIQIQETASIARRLRLPEREIREWVKARQNQALVQV